MPFFPFSPSSSSAAQIDHDASRHLYPGRFYILPAVQRRVCSCLFLPSLPANHIAGQLPSPCFFLVPNHYLLGHRHHSLVLKAILFLVWYYISQWHVTHIFDSTTFTFFSLPQLQSYQKVKNTDGKLPTYSLFLILNQLLLLQIKRQGKEVIHFSNSLDIVQVSYLHISRNSCIIVLRSF